MIVTVTPNPALDKTYLVDDFELQGIFKPRTAVTTAGGKGVNVARVGATLGCPVVATGFAGGYNGQFLVQELERRGVVPDFVTVEGETRICVEITDPEHGTESKINESGPYVTGTDIANLEKKVAGWLQRAEILVLAGSGAPGTPTDLYASLTRRAHEAGVRVILDSSGEWLRQGVDAIPHLIKPNAQELSTLLDRPVRSPQEAADAAKVMLQRGVEIVAVSLGAQGAVFASEREILYAQPPFVETLDTAGSGDAMTAGLALALLRDMPMHALARWGVAAGTANAAVLGACLCTRAEIEALLPRVSLTSLA